MKLCTPVGTSQNSIHSLVVFFSSFFSHNCGLPSTHVCQTFIEIIKTNEPFSSRVCTPFNCLAAFNKFKAFFRCQCIKKGGKSVYFSKLTGHAVSISTGVSTWCHFVCECELCSFTRKPSHFFFYSATSVVKSPSASVTEQPMGVTYLRKYVT